MKDKLQQQIELCDLEADTAQTIDSESKPIFFFILYYLSIHLNLL